MDKKSLLFDKWEPKDLKRASKLKQQNPSWRTVVLQDWHNTRQIPKMPPQKLNLLVLKSCSYQKLEIGNLRRQRPETLTDFLTSDATARFGPLHKSHDKWIDKRNNESTSSGSIAFSCYIKT